MMARRITRRELAWLAIVIAAITVAVLYSFLHQDPTDDWRDAVPDMSCPVARLHYPPLFSVI